MVPINQTISVKWMLDRVLQACSKIEFRFQFSHSDKNPQVERSRPEEMKVDDPQSGRSFN